MKKLKQLLIIAFVSVLTFTFAACSSTSSCGGTSVTELTVNTTEAKTEYYVGEDFSSDGIVVTATYSDETTAIISSEDYTLDSSAYDKTTVGSYDIGISYDGASTTYSVSVIIAPVTAIELDTSKVTTEIYIGETLDLSALAATATIADGSTKTLSYSDLTVDTSAVDTYTAGAYKVPVSYTLGTGTVQDEIIITVLSHDSALGGLKLSKTKTEYTLETTAGFTLDTSDLTVTLVTDSGESTLSAENYTLALAKDGDFLNDFTISSEGKYQIWAYYNYTIPDLKDEKGNAYTYEINSYMIVYVIDTLASITLDTSNTSAVYEQEKGSDEISSTWTYTATFASGATKQLTADDVEVDIDTRTIADSATATVSYTFVDAKGNETTKTCTVTYKITGTQAGTVSVSLDFTNTELFATGDIAGTTITEAVSLTYKDGTATGFVVTKSTNSSGNANMITTKSNTQCLQMQGSAKSTQNSLGYYLDAGTYTISVSYYTDAKTANAGRYAIVLDSSDTELSGTVTDAEKTGSEGALVTREMTITLSAGGYIYIGSKSSGLYFTAVSINGTVTDTSTSTVSLDFTNTELFATGDIAGTTITEAVSLTYKDGTATGFVVTKSTNSSGNANMITTKSNTQCLQMQGSAKSTQNSLGYYLDAGTYTISVSYYTDAKTANAGRYAIVLDSSDTELSGTVTDAEKTGSEGALVTREMTITLSAGGYIYIGSKSSGLYFTAVSIATATAS